MSPSDPTRSQTYWIIEWLADDAPTFLSLHSTKHKAQQSISTYIKDYHFGGTERDYKVSATILNPNLPEGK
jgi:hypothetical protein